ncbi:hypothetical protein KY284_011805 [Solanum tuberosum]|nr:hypothetical protein KY284_023352 [Solanum tuberosum]KAH0710378.1 hypothetical protein KY284_011805 [Solanum tuberosum]
MMGILSRKKRHKHRLSIQSIFPGLPNTLLIRKKPPAIEKRSKVWVPSITLPLPVGRASFSALSLHSS